VAFRSRKVCQCHFTIYKILYLIAIEFHDLWHSLKVPNDVDLLRQLASGKLCLYSLLGLPWLTIFQRVYRSLLLRLRRRKHQQQKRRAKKGVLLANVKFGSRIHI